MATSLRKPARKSTIRRAAKVVDELPELTILVQEPDAAPRVVKIPDPRVAYMRALKERHPSATARPHVLTGFVQVVEVLPDGTETILKPCLDGDSAARWTETFNALPRNSGSHAVARAITLPDTRVNV